MLFTGSSDRRSPMDEFGIDSDALLGLVLHMFLQYLRCHRNDVLALPIFDQVQRLQRADDVFGLN
jgi:hypothetical protein